MQHGEDAAHNPFLHALLTHIPDLEARASRNRWILLVPQCAALPPSNHLTRIALLESHVLVRSSSCRRHFVTLNGMPVSVSLKDGSITAGNSSVVLNPPCDEIGCRAPTAFFNEMRTVRVLFMENFYPRPLSKQLQEEMDKQQHHQHNFDLEMQKRADSIHTHQPQKQQKQQQQWLGRSADDARRQEMEEEQQQIHKQQQEAEQQQQQQQPQFDLETLKPDLIHTQPYDFSENYNEDKENITSPTNMATTITETDTSVMTATTTETEDNENTTTQLTNTSTTNTSSTNASATNTSATNTSATNTSATNTSATPTNNKHSSTLLKRPYAVWCVSRPLSGIGDVPLLADGRELFDPLRPINEWTYVLRSNQANSRALAGIDSFAHQLNKRSSFACCPVAALDLRARIGATVGQAIEHLCVDNPACFAAALDSGNRFHVMLRSALESCAMQGLYASLFAEQCALHHDAELELQQRLYKARDSILSGDTDTFDLGIQPWFLELDMSAAVTTLQEIIDCRSPLAKLQCVSKVVDKLTKIIQQSKTNRTPPREHVCGRRSSDDVALSTDDLLPLMVYTVLVAAPPQLLANLHYTNNFLVDSQAHGHLLYHFVHFQATIVFLQSLQLDCDDRPASSSCSVVSATSSLLSMPVAHRDQTSVDGEASVAWAEVVDEEQVSKLEDNMYLSQLRPLTARYSSFQPNTGKEKAVCDCESRSSSTLSWVRGERVWLRPNNGGGIHDDSSVVKELPRRQDSSTFSVLSGMVWAVACAKRD